MADGYFDLRDVTLEAQAELQEVVREVLQEMSLPLLMEQARRTWASLPEEMKARFADEKPNEYADLMEMMQ